MNYENENKDCCQETIHTIYKQDAVETPVQECSNGDVSAQISCLQQSVLSLLERASQIFEDIAAIAVAAQVSLETTGKYRYYLDSLKHHVEILEGISIAISESEAELDKLKQAAHEHAKKEAQEACEQAKKEAQEACEQADNEAHEAHEQTICNEQEACKQVECEPEAEQAIKTCSKCNTPNLEKHEYCFKCGNKFNEQSCNDNDCDASHKSPNIDLLQNYLQQKAVQ